MYTFAHESSVRASLEKETSFPFSSLNKNVISSRISSIPCIPQALALNYQAF